MNSNPSTPRPSSIASLNQSLNISGISVYSTNIKHNTYELVRERALLRRIFFEDPVFPADDQSLLIRSSATDSIEWKRPHEISRRPKFIGKSPENFDVTSGPLGTSWLLPAFSCLTQTPSLIQKCIPEGQAFDENYAGVFRFRFWRYGEWIEVIVDDRLPTINGKLVFMRNDDHNEFWAALLEKAYAKFYGSYQAIQGSYIHWALQDLTGGITDSFIFKENPAMMQKIIDIALERTTILSASIRDRTHRQLTAGLFTNQAYSVTGYAEIPVQGVTICLVRLRNPWGKAHWQGEWNKQSPVWTLVTEDIRQRLAFNNLSDKEFWMSFLDFSKYFTHLEMCHLSPEAWNFEPKLKHRLPWKSVEAHRQWRRGFNAGGGMSSPLVSLNSQFYIELEHESRIVLSLMQRYKLFGEHKEFVPCACLIFKAPPGRITRLQSNNFLRSNQIASTGVRMDRDIVRFFTLPAGAYVILPVTEHSGMEGKFYLRVFIDNKAATVRELDDPDTASFYQADIRLDKETMDTLHKRFSMFCNRYGEIDGYALRKILSYKQPVTKKTKVLCCEVQQEEDAAIQRVFLSPDTCKSAITIVDRNMNGRLTYEEFMELIEKLTLWQNVFQKFATGNGSVMESYALRNAFRMAGFSVSNKILEALVLRFAAKDYINIEGFINAIIKLHVAHQRNQYAMEGEPIKLDKEKKKQLTDHLKMAMFSDKSVLAEDGDLLMIQTKLAKTDFGSHLSL